MGAHMTRGLQAYDLAADADAHPDETRSAPPDTSHEHGVSAADSISRLYRKPQVHFCCTTAAMEAIETLFARCDVPHVCLATGRPDDGPAWRVTTSPNGHRVMLDSRMLVQLSNNARASAGDRHHASTEPVVSAPKTMATPKACLESLPKDKTARPDKARRRRRRRRAARATAGDRVALPLSV
ncbi:hypothetical protein pneo_cds_622 [Pandoravirus neocaledonia]|uniref:Uncharacterized protein n=1 Tax=Pandoravirus neocaledonia TaxID=2107708 RepID=A0A2U7UCN4_9VIRU|nr:hypothetical protein pneo_cds_622 [Pandoravirus neocaledonia]AVK76229.1 hypothetical protein pneo_cds_622 [Pandoravirus neocaledonia]